MKTIFQFVLLLGILPSIVSCQKKEDDKKGTVKIGGKLYNIEV